MIIIDFKELAKTTAKLYKLYCVDSGENNIITLWKM
jgi:hypothetical protein